MNRPLACPILLLVTVLLLVGCGSQAGRESRVPDATGVQTETDTPVRGREGNLEGSQIGVGTSTPASAQIAATSIPQAESSPKVSPSGSPFDSPLDPGSQQIALLPTVTPTPVQTVLPMPTQSTHPFWDWPSVEPELYAMATPYYYDTYSIAMRGITYTERTDAGFGLFQFNDVSPCLCQSLQDPDACHRALEEYQLSDPVDGVVQTEQCLSIELEDDQLVTFNDVEATTRSVRYTYARPLPDTNYYLLGVSYWEGSEYLLVDGDSGAVTLVPAYPEFSPDNRHFAVVIPLTAFVQIWSFDDDGPRYEKGWRIEQLHWVFEMTPPVITWASAARVQIHWPILDGFASPPSAPEDVTIVLEPDGWVVYHDDKPITQPIVDNRTIKFANAGIDMGEFLDTLEAGKPVYIDRDYLFTSIPDELEGATYFRIPQYYYLGEDPDYFPLEAQMANYLQFKVTARANVYVALDAQVREMPDWMQSGWQEVEISLETDDIPLQLYRKEYPAGATVGLVDSWMLEDRVPSQFIVIVAPASSG